MLFEEVQCCNNLEWSLVKAQHRLYFWELIVGSLSNCYRGRWHLHLNSLIIDCSTDLTSLQVHASQYDDYHAHKWLKKSIQLTNFSFGCDLRHVQCGKHCYYDTADASDDVLGLGLSFYAFRRKSRHLRCIDTYLKVANPCSFSWCSFTSYHGLSQTSCPISLGLPWPRKVASSVI